MIPPLDNNNNNNQSNKYYYYGAIMEYSSEDESSFCDRDQDLLPLGELRLKLDPKYSFWRRCGLAIATMIIFLGVVYMAEHEGSTTATIAATAATTTNEIIITPPSLQSTPHVDFEWKNEPKEVTMTNSGVVSFRVPSHPRHQRTKSSSSASSFTTRTTTSLLSPPQRQEEETTTPPATLLLQQQRYNKNPFFYKVVEGNFEATVKLSGATNYTSLYDHSGLMIQDSKTVWLKSGLEYVNGSLHVTSILKKKHQARDRSILRLDDLKSKFGKNDDGSNPSSSSSSSAWFKTRRYAKSGKFEVLFSLNGVQYHTIREGVFLTSNKPRVGIMASSPLGRGFYAQFEGISIESI